MPTTSSLTSGSRDLWMERFARFGLVAKGIVYLLMGTISVLAAIGLSSENGDKTKAFQFLYEQPFGRVMLVLIGAGMFGYVMLRGFQSVKDSENKGNDFK